MKKIITWQEYYQLEGLLLVALNHSKAMRDIEVAAANLLGVEENAPNYYGHVSDAVYDYTTTAKELLDKLGIDVE